MRGKQQLRVAGYAEPATATSTNGHRAVHFADHLAHNLADNLAARIAEQRVIQLGLAAHTHQAIVISNQQPHPSAGQCKLSAHHASSLQAAVNARIADQLADIVVARSVQLASAYRADRRSIAVAASISVVVAALLARLAHLFANIAQTHAHIARVLAGQPAAARHLATAFAHTAALFVAAARSVLANAAVLHGRQLAQRRSLRTFANRLAIGLRQAAADDPELLQHSCIGNALVQFAIRQHMRPVRLLY